MSAFAMLGFKWTELVGSSIEMGRVSLMAAGVLADGWTCCGSRTKLLSVAICTRQHSKSISTCLTHIVQLVADEFGVLDNDMFDHEFWCLE
jgi:hypothetical protein